jgi:Peroxidase
MKIMSIILILLVLLVHTICACPHLDRKRRRHRTRVWHQSKPLIGADADALPPHHPPILYPQPSCLTEALDVATEQIWHLIATTKGLAAMFLRLTFHDCVGGLCDGCVDLSDASNFGLRAPMQALAPVVFHNQQFLTTGDVWVLAGLVACRTSQRKDMSVEFPMQFVRRAECAGQATTRGPQRELPSAHFTTQQVLQFFDESFGFNEQESVAILGKSSSCKRESCRILVSH